LKYQVFETSRVIMQARLHLPREPCPAGRLGQSRAPRNSPGAAGAGSGRRTGPKT